MTGPMIRLALILKKGLLSLHEGCSRQDLILTWAGSFSCRGAIGAAIFAPGLIWAFCWGPGGCASFSTGLSGICAATEDFTGTASSLMAATAGDVRTGNKDSLVAAGGLLLSITGAGAD